MPTTPAWKAAKNGPQTDLNATNHAAQVNQMLGTHAFTPVYPGNLITGPGSTWRNGPIGITNFTWLSYGTGTDFAQSFTMSGTTLGRVQIPINPIGNGADLVVSLYPDNSGSPNTSNRLASTVVPASHILSMTAPTGVDTGGPLASARFNGLLPAGGTTKRVFAPSTSTSFGATTSASTASSGNFIISAGGTVSGGSATQGQVITTQFIGNGQVAAPVQQPPIPQSSFNPAFAVGGSFIFVAGGIFNNGSTSTNLVSTYTASWNSATGSIGSWSVQANLPQSVYSPGAAASPSAAYVIGGFNASNVIQNTVYWAPVNNGQISAWNVGPSYPLTVASPAVAVINGYLVVAGGQTVPGASVTFTQNVYFSKIFPDGSLGPWQLGPNFPLSGGWSYGVGANWGVATTPNHLALITGDVVITVLGSPASFESDIVSFLTVTADGPADSWTFCDNMNGGGTVTAQWGLFPTGQGQFTAVGLDFDAQAAYSFNVIPAPWVSIPLYATGLTNGATYHVVLQQKPSASASDLLQYGIMTAAMFNDAKSSPRHSGTWSTITSGMSSPMAIYDNTPGSTLYHTWEDPTVTGSTDTSNQSARSSTFIYNRLKKVAGLCESVSVPDDPMNANPTFTSGVGNWTAHNCTFVQSNAQVHGGFAFSGLMTPNGVAAAPNVTSELIPIIPFEPINASSQWYAVNGWFYSPTGWATVTLSIDWYDPSQTFISTSSHVVSLTAATWTNLVNYFLVPANASFMSIDFIESGTPAAGNTVYYSNVTISAAPELAPSFGTASQLTYNAAGVATGVSQIA